MFELLQLRSLTKYSFGIVVKLEKSNNVTTGNST